MLFWKFSNIFIYVNIVGKIPDQHLNVSRGQGLKKMEIYGTNMPCTFNKNLDLVPWIGELPYTQMLILYFPTILTYMIMLEKPEQHFSEWLFSNPGDRILFFEIQ